MSNSNSNSSNSSNSSMMTISISENSIWRGVCRYVIPMIGYAIEENVCGLHDISQLDDIKYYYHHDGDYENGLTLFHYACKAANLPLIEKPLC